MKVEVHESIVLSIELLMHWPMTYIKCTGHIVWNACQILAALLYHETTSPFTNIACSVALVSQVSLPIVIIIWKLRHNCKVFIYENLFMWKHRLSLVNHLFWTVLITSPENSCKTPWNNSYKTPEIKHKIKFIIMLSSLSSLWRYFTTWLCLFHCLLLLPVLSHALFIGKWLSLMPSDSSVILC